MQNKAILAGYGLKWNPFSFDTPHEGLVITDKMKAYCDRVEDLVIDGGFAMITGEPGTGKSVMLRVLAERLTQIRELSVAVIERPQSGLVDFYREISLHFGLEVNVNNRWSTYKTLRERWLKHIESTSIRPVIFIDEAQELPAVVLSELRILSSAHFDSKSITTIILCGDDRLGEKMQSSELLPLASRIRTRFIAQSQSRENLIALLEERMEKAGNHKLMSKELIATVAEHSMGNPRLMITLSDELFSKAIKSTIATMVEKIVLCNIPKKRRKKERGKTMKCACKCCGDPIIDRISLLLAYLENALKELILYGIKDGNIGDAELDYREVYRQIITELDKPKF